jgi:hypothetical protein
MSTCYILGTVISGKLPFNEIAMVRCMCIEKGNTNNVHVSYNMNVLCRHLV